MRRLTNSDLSIGDVVTLPPICEHSGEECWLHGVPLEVVSLDQDMMGNIQLRIQKGQKDRFVEAAKVAGLVDLYGLDEVLRNYPDDGSGISVSEVISLDLKSQSK